MSKHTPGPWVAKQEFVNRWRIESHANGPEFIPISVGIACTTILEVGCTDEDTAGNARLIAAAPDLLDALKDAVAAWETFYPLFPVNRDIEDAEFDQLNKARAAICKALGLQPWDYHKHVARAEGNP